MSTDIFHDLSELELWQTEQTKLAIAEADAGDFSAPAVLQAILAKYDPPIRLP